MYRNLIPGQWQIGDILIGRNTNIRVETADVKPYDVNAQDYQVSRSDEMRFGFDQFKPTSIELTMHVLHNRLLPAYEGTIPNFWHNMPTVHDLAREWRFDEGRNVWGQMKPLYVCSKLDEIPKIVFGRPGQFAATADDEYNQGEVVKVLGEFRRADTLAYSVTENFIDLQLSADPVYLIRNQGDGPDAWLRFLLEGPLTHPVITVGDQQIEIDAEIPAGKMAEISSYPWQRRAVNSDRVNLAANLIGKTKYLDKLRLPFKKPIPLKWTSVEANTMVPALGDQSWAEDIDKYNLFALPSTFTTINGQASVYFDLFNFGSQSFPWITPRKYLCASLFSNVAAILYNEKQFNTSYQYSKAQIVNPRYGKSGIVIMSNEDMTNLACLIVEMGVLGNYLRIATGSWDNLTVRASWLNVWPWMETDEVAIEYDSDTNTYTAYLNNDDKTSWVDNGAIVSETNRHQGYIFDIDGNLLTEGIGFAELVSYDTLEEPAQTGKVVLLWRDTYTVI